MSQFATMFANPLVAILLAAALVSAAFGQRTDAGIIVAIVAVGLAINFWQTFRSARAAERLRSSVAPTATVARDGEWREVPIATVVPGDLFRLSAGDLVPADGQVLAARDLSVQQAALTGEPLPVSKEVSPESSGGRDPRAPGHVFVGTSVVSGIGVAEATATGPKTVFGDIASRLATRPPETEFERGVRHFSLLILRTTIALLFFILIAALALRRDPIESLLFAVALAVGLTPEFLPMIASVTLTAGAIRMARDGVVVKHLPAIQNFGSIDILCSDKTGTLTRGEMRVERSADASGLPSPRALSLAALNSRFETGIKSPLDAAILAETQAPSRAFTKVDELPFDFERRRLSVVVDTPEGDRLLVTKGAPESIVALSVTAEYGNQSRLLDDDSRRRAVEFYQQLGDQGLRVLAVAWRRVDRRDGYGPADERDLVLAGFVSFADPVRADAAAAVQDLARDGVVVKILTGDNERVAACMCGSVGLTAEVVTGETIARIDDAALGHLAEQASVFARVSPSQKTRIIMALKRRGHVVGFIGDGINDAPSLHAADIGISVLNATDVARESADVILGESGLRVLHRGILEGRRAAVNLMKYLLMGTSSNFGNMVSMAAASVFLPFLPMLPTQILLNNLLYDVAQIAIPTDRVDPSYLSHPQRWDLTAIRNFMLLVGPVSSIFDFLTFYVLLRVLHAPEALFHTGWFVESLATQTLVLFVIRTARNPFRSRPSPALTATTILVASAGVLLPFTPMAPALGFTPPPVGYFAFLAVATGAYLVAVEGIKRVVRRGPARR